MKSVFGKPFHDYKPKWIPLAILVGTLKLQTHPMLSPTAITLMNDAKYPYTISGAFGKGGDNLEP